MTDILDQIMAYKKGRISELKKHFSTGDLKMSPLFERKVFSISKALKAQGSSGIIAEFKRRSPSKGFIREGAEVSEIIPAYESAGACAVSVLTDSKYFGGCISDLKEARSCCNLPILRKDFIVDQWQIAESKAIGADAILLIARSLTAEEILEFSQYARSLDLEVLVEVHSEAELEKVLIESVNVIGVNNRNLQTFEVSTDLSFDLCSRIPAELARISESGLSDPKTAAELRKAGYDGFLIGENFMKAKDPGECCADFLRRASCGND